MLTIDGIKAAVKITHDTLSDAFYTKKGSTGVTPQEQADFDAQHKQIWDDCEAEVKTASDYVEPIPDRDLLAEINALKDRIASLEKV